MTNGDITYLIHSVLSLSLSLSLSYLNLGYYICTVLSVSLHAKIAINYIVK